MSQETTAAPVPTQTAGSDVVALEQAYRDALAKFKADKTNKDLRRARTAAKKAWDQAVLQECLQTGDSGAQQLYCRDCSQMFLWTTEEQDYYKAAERLWRHKPQRCRKCAESQKARRKSQHLKHEETFATADDDNHHENNNSEATTRKRAGKNMCYAFQKGNCPYGDRCKFNHDPDFAGKSKEEEDEAEERAKKRKVAPDIIPLCKWGKDCKLKKCRFRHDVEDGDGSLPTTCIPVVDQQVSTRETNHKTEVTEATNSSKKPKVMGICKWGKNCKLKRCRFQHPDDDSPSSPPSLPVEKQTNAVSATAADPSLTNKSSNPTTSSAVTPSGTLVQKSQTKSDDKLVHKAMTKALKKAPKNKLRVKDLRKLVRKKLNGMGKDESKIVVKQAIARNKDSMALLEDGTVVKLLV